MENKLIIQKIILDQILPKKPFASTGSKATKGVESTNWSLEINSMLPMTSPTDMGA